MAAPRARECCSLRAAPGGHPSRRSNSSPLAPGGSRGRLRRDSQMRVPPSGVRTRWNARVTDWRGAAESPPRRGGRARCGAAGSGPRAALRTSAPWPSSRRNGVSSSARTAGWPGSTDRLERQPVRGDVGHQPVAQPGAARRGGSAGVVRRSSRWKASNPGAGSPSAFGERLFDPPGQVRHLVAEQHDLLDRRDPPAEPRSRARTRSRPAARGSEPSA